MFFNESYIFKKFKDSLKENTKYSEAWHSIQLEWPLSTLIWLKQAKLFLLSVLGFEQST